MSTITLGEWRRKLGDAAGPELARVIAAALLEAGEVARGEAATLATTRHRVRSGRLRAGISVRVTDVPRKQVVLTNDVIYARIQEEGGTVRPKHASFLAVPLQAALTPTGRLKARFDVGSLREVKGLFVLRDGKNLFLAESKGKTGTLLFSLVKSVTLEGQHIHRDGLKAGAEHLGVDLRARVAKLLKGAA